MELAVRRETLDGGDLAPARLEGEVRARVERPTVEEHHAGAALGVVAALLRTGETEVVPEGGKERAPRLELEPVRNAVDAERDRVSHAAPLRARSVARSSARLTITGTIAFR
jgi:hypothetical protein